MPIGLIAFLLLTQGLFDFKKCLNVLESAAAKMVYIIIMCDSVCGTDDIYIIIN